MFTWWHWVLSSEKGKPQCMCLLKDLPLWCLLMFHWPKIITWSSPDSWWGRTETNYLLLERNSRVILHTGLHLGRNIVIIFINRKHRSGCSSWGQRHQFSFACCVHYKWSNKLSLLTKNFHNCFQPEGTFLFVFKHSAILIYVNVKISTFFSPFNPIYRILFSTRKTPK